VVRDSQENPGEPSRTARWRDRHPPGAGTDLPAARLGELVAQLTGEDPRDSAEATEQRLDRTEAADPLAVVAQAIVDLRDSRHALRVTRYVERNATDAPDATMATGAMSGDVASSDHAAS
jgi:hypothetical protein